MTDPADDTQGGPMGPASPPEAADPTPPTPPNVPDGPLGEPAPPPPPPPSPPPLTADPNRPADSGWREPPWIPARPRDRGPSLAALLIGFGLIAVGLWFFVDRTLGIDLPSIQWRSLWPVVLIVIGGAILLRSLSRSR